MRVRAYVRVRTNDRNVMRVISKLRVGKGYDASAPDLSALVDDKPYIYLLVSEVRIIP